MKRLALMALLAASATPVLAQDGLPDYYELYLKSCYKAVTPVPLKNERVMAHVMRVLVDIPQVYPEAEDETDANHPSTRNFLVEHIPPRCAP